MKLVHKFSTRKIAVIGDIILDKYIHGESAKLSPEAPVPVVKVNRDSVSYRLGGAANVAANIKALGGNPILLGITGCDPQESIVLRLLADADIPLHGIYRIPDRPTTTKVRLIANNQQVARMDMESSAEISAQMAGCIAHQILVENVTAVIVSDYAKGVITRYLLDDIYTIVRKRFGVPLFIDPKVEHAEWYRNTAVTAMTPNKREAEAMKAVHATSYGHEYLVKTLGEHGLNVTGGSLNSDIPSTAKHVFDVSGAGDTIIAALTLAYVSGYHMLVAAQIANAAAGIAVGKHGTSTVSFDELRGSVI